MEIGLLLSLYLKQEKEDIDDAIERSLLDKGILKILFGARAIAGKPKRIDKRSRAVKRLELQL